MASHDAGSQPQPGDVDAILAERSEEKSASYEYARLERWLDLDWSEWAGLHFKLTKGQANHLCEVAELMLLLQASTTGEGNTGGLSQVAISEEQVKPFRLGIKRRLYKARREEVSAVSKLRSLHTHV
jgi:hypothetical protein